MNITIKLISCILSFPINALLFNMMMKAPPKVFHQLGNLSNVIPMWVKDKLAQLPCPICHFLWNCSQSKLCLIFNTSTEKLNLTINQARLFKLTEQWSTLNIAVILKNIWHAWKCCFKYRKHVFWAVGSFLWHATSNWFAWWFYLIGIKVFKILTNIK